MTPEAKARTEIDARLALAGWRALDFRALNLGTMPGIAVREFPSDTSPADEPSSVLLDRICTESELRLKATGGLGEIMGKTA